MVMDALQTKCRAIRVLNLIVLLVLHMMAIEECHSIARIMVKCIDGARARAFAMSNQ